MAVLFGGARQLPAGVALIATADEGLQGSEKNQPAILIADYSFAPH